MKENIVNHLKKIKLFNGLPLSQLKYIAAISKKRYFKKGKIIFNENTIGYKLYLIITGRIKIFLGTGKRKKTLTYFDPGEFFGELALLGKKIRSASAEAIIDSEILTLSKNDFLEIINRYPNIAINLIKTLAERLYKTDREIETLTFETVPGRIAKVLLDLSKKYGKKTSEGIILNINIDKKEIAEIAGTVREVASRVIKHFIKLHYIGFKNKKIIIKMPEKLKSLVR